MSDFFSWLSSGLPAFLFVITVVVFFHELGHFWVARLFGVKVETFSIGFGRELVGWTDRKGTRWKISWLPFGGYVKFFGDLDETSRPAPELSHAPKRVQNEALQFKPLYQRSLVVAAGPLANFVLAIAIFTGVFLTVGKPAGPAVITGIMPNSAAAAAGLHENDVVRAVDGKPVTALSELQRAISDKAGRPLTLTIKRGKSTLEVSATPASERITDLTGQARVAGRLGIRIANQFVPVAPLEAIGLSVSQTWFIIEQTMRYLGGLVIGQESARDLSGPLGIAKISGDVAQVGFLALVNLVALISVSIGLINLFPIPVLDGGHLLYYGFEAVLGRPLGAKAQEVGFRLGLALVLSLMLWATFNDLIRLNLF